MPVSEWSNVKLLGQRKTTFIHVNMSSQMHLAFILSNNLVRVIVV